jgi:hypothetical protein
MTGQLWAHELFDLPCPPDVVTWAKKAQNGVLFVSEELATFFQEEKKFNTTWEGDSTGMVRLLAKIEKLDLEAVRRTGDRARAGLELLAKEHREIIRNVRGRLTKRNRFCAQPSRISSAIGWFPIPRHRRCVSAWERSRFRSTRSISSS